jgi:integrase
MLVSLPTADGSLVQVDVSALAALLGLQAELPGTRPLALAGKSVSMIAAAQRWADEHKQVEGRKGGWRKRTLERNRADVNTLVMLKQHGAIADVDVAMVRTYLAKIAGLALRSQKSRWATVQGFLAWCVRRELLVANPCDKFHKNDKPWARHGADLGRGKPQLFGEDEIDAYMLACNRWLFVEDRLLAALPFMCAMRPQELLHLRACDVDLQRNLLNIGGKRADGYRVKTESSNARMVLPADLRADFARIVQGKAGDDSLFPAIMGRAVTIERKVQLLNDLVRRTCTAAGVRIVPTYGLRGSGASFLADKGVSLKDISAFLRHADGGQTATAAYVGAPLLSASNSLSPSPA